MIDWFSLIGKEKQIKNKAGVSQNGLKLLIKDFKDLDHIKKNLTTRILQFILDGKNRKILSELEMLDIFFKAPHFAPLLGSAETRAELFQGKNEEGEAFLKRLGQVYHALMNPLNPNFLMPQRFKSPSWLEALLLFASSSYAGDLRTYLQLKIIEHILIAAEEGLDNVVRYVFLKEPKDFSHLKIIKTFFSLTGFSSTILEYEDVVKEALTHKNSTTRACAVKNITALQLPVENFLDYIVGCATSSRKKVRIPALKLLKEHPAASIPRIKGKIEKGTSSERYQAAMLLEDFLEYIDYQYLNSLLQNSSDEKVKTVIENMIKNIT
jgi:hypothetical protein